MRFKCYTFGERALCELPVLKIKEIIMPQILFIVLLVAAIAYAIIAFYKVKELEEKNAKLLTELNKPIRLRVWFSFKTKTGGDASYEGTVYHSRDGGLMPAPEAERSLIPSPFPENRNENLLRGPFAPVEGQVVKILGADYTFA